MRPAFLTSVQAILLLALALPGAALGDMMDSTVTLPAPRQPITATLHSDGAPKGPAVLLLHGFTGTRDEMAIPGAGEGVFARTARLMGAEGFASLRIDFRGSGDSTGAMSFADSDIESQVADTLLALDWLRRRGHGPLHLLGWSQGGLVAALAAGRGAEVASVSLWNAVAEPQVSYPRILGPAMMAEGLAARDPGTLISTTLPWGAGIRLRGRFFDQLAHLDPATELAGYPGPLLVAWGSRDPLVPETSARRLLESHSGPQVIYRAGFDHAFDISQGTRALDALIAETLRFLPRP
ncbi:MAG: alpha/beta hydrolase [Rhodobacteraceae bacterium]|nr:alpha/beta hydrolase [Paracoccaceae bacterium]